MGRFKCDYCDEIVKSSDKCYDFTIINYAKWSVCDNCGYELSRSLTLANPPDYYCWVVSDDTEILTEGTFQQVKEWINQNNPSNYSFVYYESCDKNPVVHEQVRELIVNSKTHRDPLIQHLDRYDDFLHLLKDGHEWNVTEEFLQGELYGINRETAKLEEKRIKINALLEKL